MPQLNVGPFHTLTLSRDIFDDLQKTLLIHTKAVFLQSMLVGPLNNSFLAGGAAQTVPSFVQVLWKLELSKCSETILANG